MLRILLLATLMLVGPLAMAQEPSGILAQGNNPLSIPAIDTGTTCSPNNATMPCNGRTQRRLSVEIEASPQRIDLGQGKARTTASTISATTSGVPRPCWLTCANQTPSRSTS